MDRIKPLRFNLHFSQAGAGPRVCLGNMQPQGAAPALTTESEKI